MTGIVIAGAQWGDEGKGKFIDLFAADAAAVVRAQGGSNAAHTVKYNGETYNLRQIPDGVFYDQADSYIGPGVVVDPRLLLEECDSLAMRGVNTSRVYVDARAHVIMPWHIIIDRLAETARKHGEIGTTLRGVGPCYMDKAGRIGLRMHDFVDPNRFENAVRAIGEAKNNVITKLYGAPPLDLDVIVGEYRHYSERLRPRVADTSAMLHALIRQGKQVVFDCALGSMLDIDMGTYPYVTSSHPVAGGAFIGSGVGASCAGTVIGVAKAYTTRIGKGAFPTELRNDIGDFICLKGGENNVMPGRQSRCGWFDAVVVRYSARVNGFTEMAVNKIDPLCGLLTLKICTAYRLDGRILDEFPADFSDLERCEPIYEEYEGFDEDITKITSYEKLPEAVKLYVDAIEKACDCPVRMLGVGPGRDQIIHRR